MITYIFNIQDNYPAFDDSFNNLGYSSILFIQNIGIHTISLMISLAIYICLTLILLILKRIFNNSRVENLLYRGRKKLSIDPFERIFIESFINISLSAIINAIYFSTNKILCEIVSSLTTILAFGILISIVLFSSLGI